MPVTVDDYVDYKNPAAPPPHCYEWLHPDDMLRHSLAAFYQACRFHDHAHRAFPEDPPSTRNAWLDHVLAILEARILAEAQARKIKDLEFGNAKTTLEGYTEMAWLPVNYSSRDTQDNIHCRARRLIDRGVAPYDDPAFQRRASPVTSANLAVDS